MYTNTLLEKALANRGLTGKPVMLDVGAGGFSSDSKFLSVDAFTECDIKAFMWDIPVPDNSVDTIFASHCLEHVSKFDVIPTLREWRRILKPQGHLQILVPDLEWVCSWFLAHQSTDWDMDIIFGNQKHEGEFHKTGFTPTIMKDYFDIAGGFSIESMYYDGGDFYKFDFDPGYRHRNYIVNVAGRSIVVQALKL